MKIALTIILACVAVILVWAVIALIPTILDAVQDVIIEYDRLKELLKDRKARKEQ